MHEFAHQRIKLVRETTAHYNADPYFNSPLKAVLWAREVFKIDEESQEVVLGLFLNTKGKIVGAREIGRGGIDFCPCCIAGVFKSALLYNASSIILMHNHPSGIATFSEADNLLSKQCLDAGKLLGINFIDHIVVGEFEYASYKENGKKSFFL